MAKEYKNRYRPYDAAYQKRPEIRAAKNARNRNRYLMIKKYGKARLKGKDIDHKNGNPLDNRRSNLQIMDSKKNRAKH